MLEKNVDKNVNDTTYNEFNPTTDNIVKMSWMLEKNVDKNVNDTTYNEFNPTTDNIVKMRGLPFEAGPPEIVRFFEGLAVSQSGILICKDTMGRPCGEAYTQLES